MPKTDITFLCREWVEIREESEGSRTVFRPLEYPIPPARGRRHLNLGGSGVADAKVPGPTDKLVSEGGEWSLQDQHLMIEAPGWEGDYDIEELREDILVLRKK